ncbi:hypothetical protein ATE48_17415 [Candidatus Viadribacter manganicus]|uniref:PNPLA domain-containing protein n=1 Tax=Candidatus Viadribacter manganicus TaxID=1759059 RepID=A0A1B1ALZ7_9PROT|nr:hypothetical protein ATE48_17415 [Candidatus Viadribacter manganicus]
MFGPGPKRVLSLDGGGIRGIVTVGMLESVESLLRDTAAPEQRSSFRLSDHFDLIVGTSTGSIIATLLALGASVDEVREHYLSLGPAVFARPRLFGQFLWSKFDHVAFEALLKEKLGERRLNSVDLRTGLVITCKRVDTGSAWILANNPKAKYWPFDQDRLLRDLVRASTAAPSYFAPTEIHVGNGEVGLFLDGAMGGMNNPALAAFLYATASEYGLKWAPGENELSILSLGTGHLKPVFSRQRFRGEAAAGQALFTLKGLLFESQTSAVAVLQALSNSARPFSVNSEIKGFEETLIGGRPLLRFQRFDPPLARTALAEELGIKVSEQQARELASMDNGSPKNMERLLNVGRVLGQRISIGDLVPAQSSAAAMT